MNLSGKLYFAAFIYDQTCRGGDCSKLDISFLVIVSD